MNQEVWTMQVEEIMRTGQSDRGSVTFDSLDKDERR